MPLGVVGPIPVDNTDTNTSKVIGGAMTRRLDSASASFQG
jgi:hypothetical protein